MSGCDMVLATFAGAPDGAPDDQVLASALRDLGAVVRFAAWDDRSIDWSASPVTVVRSTWDYHLRPGDWREWLKAVDAVTRLVNSAALVRWNMDKSYLLDLERKGVAVVPTRVIRRGEHAGLENVRARTGWSDVVIKPAIAGSAYGARRFDGAEPPGAPDRHLHELLARGDVLIQPYQTSVEEARERSLVFFDGVFSHAFTKSAFSPGASAGVTSERNHEPDQGELAFAECVLAKLDELPVYARVDIVPVDDGPRLMELELIEPNLRFSQRWQGARHMASALLRIRADGVRTQRNL